MLTSELAIRLHESRELTPGLWPKTISMHMSQGWSERKSKQAPFPSPRTVTIDLVFGEAMKLWNEMCKEGWRQGMKITHMGVSFHGITWMEEGQRGIATFMAPLSRPVSSKDRARSESVGARDVGGEHEKHDIGQKRKRRSVSVTPLPQDSDVDIIDVDQDQGKRMPSYSDVVRFVNR